MKPLAMEISFNSDTAETSNLKNLIPNKLRGSAKVRFIYNY